MLTEQKERWEREKKKKRAKILTNQLTTMEPLFVHLRPVKPFLFLPQHTFYLTRIVSAAPTTTWTAKNFHHETKSSKKEKNSREKNQQHQLFFITFFVNYFFLGTKGKKCWWDSRHSMNGRKFILNWCNNSCWSKSKTTMDNCSILIRMGEKLGGLAYLHAYQSTL